MHDFQASSLGELISFRTANVLKGPHFFLLFLSVQVTEVDLKRTTLKVFPLSTPGLWWSWEQSDRKEMAWLWSLFTIYYTTISQRCQRRDLVLVCNCVKALPHAVPSASSVSSPNLHCLSPDK